MLLDINFLDVGKVRFQKLPMAKNGEKWRKMAKNGDGEFAFFICQIRHFAIGPPPFGPILSLIPSQTDNLFLISAVELGVDSQLQIGKAHLTLTQISWNTLFTSYNFR